MRGASWMSGQPRESQPRYRARPALAAKIGFNHSLVGLDDAGRPLGQLLAVVEDEDRLAESHHHLHVVLHEEHGLASIAKLPHGVQEVVEEGAIDTRRRLVEEDELRVRHEDADELQELLLAVGEIARVLAGQPLELDEAEELLGALARLRVVIGGDHEKVLKRRQLGKDPDDLEGAPDAFVKDLVRLEPVDPSPLEADLALVTLLDAGDAVEERGLARAVGADQAVDAAGLEAEGDAVHRDDAAESLHHAIHLENGAKAAQRHMVRGRLYFCCRTPRMPRGMKSTTMTMMAPKRSWWT